MLRSLISILTIARSSFRILPANRSSSKNSISSLSGRVKKQFSITRSSFSKHCKYQDATASDINNSTSPLSQFPESITTDFMLLSCSAEFEATRIGALLKLSDLASGKLFTSTLPRRCNRQASPKAIAFHEGNSLFRSSSTPTKAANDPVRAFVSAYHDRFRPFHESRSSRPSAATTFRNSSDV